MRKNKENGIDLTIISNVLTVIAFCLIAAFLGITYLTPNQTVNLGIVVNNDGTCSKAEMEYRCASYYNRCIFYTNGDTLGPYGDDSIIKSSLNSEECKLIAQKVYKKEPQVLNTIISYEYYDTEIKYSNWSEEKPNCPDKNLETRMVNKNYQCNKMKLDNNRINK